MAPPDAEFVPFTAQTRMSGVDLPDGRRIRKGASDAVIEFVKENGGSVPDDLDALVRLGRFQGRDPPRRRRRRAGSQGWSSSRTS